MPLISIRSNISSMNDFYSHAFTFSIFSSCSIGIIDMPEGSPTAYLDEMVNALQAEYR
jgi:hypothetical protein